MKPVNAYEMRWNCLEHGCFNHKKRVKFASLAECFPGRINFSDVDGIVEIAGHALLLEMKEAPQPLQTGQRLLYQRLTQSDALWVLLIAGDARQMVLTHQAYVRRGVVSEWKSADLQSVNDWIARWAAWAQNNPASVGAAA